MRERITPPPDCWIIICFSFLGDFLIHQISFNPCCFGNRWTATLNSFIGAKTALLYLEGEVGSGTREDSLKGCQSRALHQMGPWSRISCCGTRHSQGWGWQGQPCQRKSRDDPCALRFFPIIGCLAIVPQIHQSPRHMVVMNMKWFPSGRTKIDT